jgi:Flp pilus assembly protein TadB
MVAISTLWLPIVLSAVIVFVASALIHMVLTYHRTDYQKLPNEDRLLAAIRAENVAPGEYIFPHASSPKEMGTPEMIEKFKKGPMGFLTLRPGGAPAMGKPLAQWFVFCLVAGLFAAYLAGRTLGPGVGYLPVFRVVGAVTFLAYAGAQPIASIWRGQEWGLTLKQCIDGLLYACLTAGTFGWLWPK